MNVEMLLIILSYLLVFCLGFFLGRHLEEKQNIRQINKVLDDAMEEERLRLIAK